MNIKLSEEVANWVIGEYICDHPYKRGSQLLGALRKRTSIPVGVIVHEDYEDYEGRDLCHIIEKEVTMRVAFLQPLLEKHRELVRAEMKEQLISLFAAKAVTPEKRGAKKRESQEK